MMFPSGSRLLGFFALSILSTSTAWSSSGPRRSTLSMIVDSKKVIVTGAAGRTGRLVYKALTADPTYLPVGIVRSKKSAKKLRKDLELNETDDCVVVSDIAKWGNDNKNQHAAIDITLLQNSDAMIICTSAVPQIRKLKLIWAFLKAPFNLLRGKKAIDPRRDIGFRFKANQFPELIDYQGQLAQIDAAKKLGIPHVIIVSSMGGTDPSNFLNSIGKDSQGNYGDILLWKRKAEIYLVESGLQYTIIHPGGLLDTPSGMKELVLDVDDKLLERNPRSISRGDVANLCVASLSSTSSVSFDCITQDPTGDSVATAEEALRKFLTTKKTANYNLFSEPVPCGKL